MRLLCLAALLAFYTLAANAQHSIPSIIEKDGRHALLVDGKPFLILGGQAHNSSAWPAMLPKVWRAIETMHANTLEVPIYWEQIEATQGKFDLSLVDTLLTQARAHKVRLVLLWFATWKNGSNHYMPEWMKKEPSTYPNITGRDGETIDSPAPDEQATLNADAKAFAAVMRHLKKADPQRTVIMVQVENEPGSWNSVRDFSPRAQKAFEDAVPAELMQPSVLTALQVAVASSGNGGENTRPGALSWKEVFGDRADEYFQAWSIARFIGQVAAAGKAEYPLPMYVNAALRDPLTNPPATRYESGGPTDNVLPIWKTAAPAIDILAPDIYLSGTARVLKVLDLYSRPDNALFVPEAGLIPENAKYLYAALGHGAIGFSPFGIDDNSLSAEAPDVLGKDDDAPHKLYPYGAAYAALSPMMRDLAQWVFDGKVRAVVEPDDHTEQRIDFADWQARVTFGKGRGYPLPGNTPPTGKLMIVQLSSNKFIITGTNCRVTFHPLGRNAGKAWQYLKVEEGSYTNGQFRTSRILNGDETDWGGPLFGDNPVILQATLQEGAAPANTAVVPVPKLEEDGYNWWGRHAEVLRIKDSIDPEIILIGNSITHYWGGLPQLKNVDGTLRRPNGSAAWDSLFGSHRVLNLGFGWDRTQNVLWRLDHGEMDGLHPRLVIIDIGTNNTSETPHARMNTAPEIVEGIAAVCKRVHEKTPAATIVVMAIFPREQSTAHPRRQLIEATNKLLEAYTQKEHLIFVNTWNSWLAPDGTMLPGLTSDLTHPTEKGYTIWADAIRPYVREQQKMTPALDAESRLSRLLKEKDFFRLENELNYLRGQITKQQQLYFQAFLDNAFSKNKEVIEHTGILLNDLSSQLPDSAKAALYLLRGDSYFKLFQYANAAKNDSILTSLYAKELDSNEVADLRNKRIIYNGLKAIPPQQTLIPHNTTVHWEKNKIGIVEIPVRSQNVPYQAVFDTRANISAITQSYATKLHLQTLPVYYYEGSGITGIQFKTSLAIADSLFIGDILIRHAVFQVVPDSVLYIAPVDFQINIIIGFPIIAAMREIHFYKDGRLKVPATVTRSSLHNLALDRLNPVISLRTATGDSLCFAFDFGANRTMLFAAYFQRYRQEVLANGIKKTTEYGGAGGAQKKEVLTLPSVDLFLAGKKVTLDSVDVLSEKVYPGETFYGNIGQDFVGSFQELVLNFQDMYMKGF